MSDLFVFLDIYWKTPGSTHGEPQKGNESKFGAGKILGGYTEKQAARFGNHIMIDS